MAVGSLKFREIDLGKKLGFEKCEAKAVANPGVSLHPVCDSKLAFERYVSSPLVFLLLL